MFKYFISLFVLLFVLVISSNAQTADKTKESRKDKTTKTNSKTTTTKPSPTESGLKWYNWNEGYTMAVKKKKIIIVDIYTDWCGWCKKMDRDTYAKQSIIDMLNKDFVAVKFNPEVKFDTYDIEGAKYNNSTLFAMLCNNERVGYPTTVFLIKNKKNEWVNYYQSGYQDEANFKKVLEYYLTLKEK